MIEDAPSSQNHDFETWLQQEARFVAAAMQRCISATHLVRRRTAFGQTITPSPGSVVASTEFADYNPEPDYFFHWLRDSALVMDALCALIKSGQVSVDGHALFADFIGFSLALGRIDTATAHPNVSIVNPLYRQYLRSPEEFQAVTGDSLLAEARFNPDGSLDILKWARPQLDGPALRALALMRYWPLCHGGKDTLKALICQDLRFVLSHALEPSFDIWEEMLGQHYYTRLVHLGALFHGADWFRSVTAASDAKACEERAVALGALLDAHWCPGKGLYLARADRDGVAGDCDPDFSIILGVLHADLPNGAHSLLDPKVHATLAYLEDLFSGNLEINNTLAKGLCPVLGRYPADHYFGGGAWYVATLGAAEFYFRLAAKIASGEQLENYTENRAFRKNIANGALQFEGNHTNWADAFFQRGNGFLATVRLFTPLSGELSEQIDRITGQQTSARNLAWSYASFITACRARRAARISP